MFSGWESTYNYHNKNMEEQKSQMGFTKSEIPEVFKNKYHNYHHGLYKTEHTHSLGIHGDQPFEKFFNKTQGKMYSDNFPVALGTTKPTGFIPGYTGHIPINEFKVNNTTARDPYFNVNKTNHMLNYKIKLPNFGGSLPENPSNIKGVTRPYCLSTRGESFK
jgi:hypothetical protein